MDKLSQQDLFPYNLFFFESIRLHMHNKLLSQNESDFDLLCCLQNFIFALLHFNKESKLLLYAITFFIEEMYMRV